MEKTKENKYIVLKVANITSVLTDTEKDIFNLLVSKINSGKPSNKYYVINTDEPYSNEILKVIFTGEEKKYNTDYHKLEIIALLTKYLPEAAINVSKDDIDDTYSKLDFCFESYPLAGNLANEIMPEIMDIMQIIHSSRFYWRLVNFSLIQDKDEMKYTYTGEIAWKLVSEEEKDRIYD